MSSEVKDRKVILSTLWIFLSVNYIFCDVVTGMNSRDLKCYLSGTVGSLQLDESFLLAASMLMEIPFVMILVSRLCNYKANRLINIIAASVMTLVQVSSFFVGTDSTMHYKFFSIIEIGCTLFIVWYSWSWDNTKTN